VAPVKILWVKANKLLPANSGGDIRSYNILRQLARCHHVTLLSYYDGMRDHAYEAELRQHFVDAVCVCTGKNANSVLRRKLDYLLHLADSRPYAVSRFTCFEVQQKLTSWYSSRSFDVVVCDFLDAAVNFPETLTITSVLFQHNVESEIWRRHLATESNFLLKALYGLEFNRMSRYERKIVQNFHHVIAVSEHDRELMTRWRNPLRISVVPTGVDVTMFKSTASQLSSPRALVVFVGAMDWEPNVDAVEFFCAEILPRIQNKIPEVRFRIVGRNPGQRVERLRGDSVEVTGIVPRVLDHLQEAAVVVVPLRVAGGTRLKIYEAMAAGKAVVSTSIGAEGLDVHHGRDVILADTAAEFADAVVMLVGDGKLRLHYERAAAELVSQFDWPIVGEKFSHALQAALEVTVELAGTQAVGEREA
jgi:polysaccharide biosynthesis protein PslH